MTSVLIFCVFTTLLFRVYCGDKVSSDNTCGSELKVYVYEISPELLERAEAARKNGEYHICKKCIFEQFSLEYIVYDYFMQHCGRTQNPEEADYFYLPIIREIDYRIALSNGGKRAPSIIEEALLDAVEKNDLQKWGTVFSVTDKYWHKGNGSNHIIVMPAPVTNFRHQTNMRGFFHYVSIYRYLLALNPFIYNIAPSVLINLCCR